MSALLRDEMCHAVQAQGGGMPFAQPMGFGQGGFSGQGMFPGLGRQGPLGQPAAAERPKEVIISYTAALHARLRTCIHKYTFPL